MFHDVIIDANSTGNKATALADPGGPAGVAGKTHPRQL